MILMLEEHQHKEKNTIGSSAILLQNISTWVSNGVIYTLKFIILKSCQIKHLPIGTQHHHKCNSFRPRRNITVKTYHWWPPQETVLQTQFIVPSALTYCQTCLFIDCRSGIALEEGSSLWPRHQDNSHKNTTNWQLSHQRQQHYDVNQSASCVNYQAKRQSVTAEVLERYEKQNLNLTDANLTEIMNPLQLESTPAVPDSKNKTKNTEFLHCNNRQNNSKS